MDYEGSDIEEILKTGQPLTGGEDRERTTRMAQMHTEETAPMVARGQRLFVAQVQCIYIMYIMYIRYGDEYRGGRRGRRDYGSGGWNER